MKGKNYSCNNLGQRKKSDFYETPYSITKQLLNRVKLIEPILEPACGNGAIMKVLLEQYGNVRGYDIQDKTIRCDFLKETEEYGTIITNPPFSLAEEFIDKALTLSNNIYFLLPLAYLHGKKRYDKFYNKKAQKLSEIFVFTRYPMLGDPLREDGKYRTGMMVYAWFHFENNAGLYPKINWIDNNKYVVNKKDL